MARGAIHAVSDRITKTRAPGPAPIARAPASSAATLALAAPEAVRGGAKGGGIGSDPGFLSVAHGPAALAAVIARARAHLALRQRLEDL